MPNNQMSEETNFTDIFIRDTSTQIMSCSAVYEKALAHKHLTLLDCDQMLAKSVTEVNNAIDQHSLFSALLAIARVTKMVCDVIIHLVAKITGPAGTAIQVAYSNANRVVGGAAGGIDKKMVVSLVAGNKATVTDSILETMGKKNFALAGDFVFVVELIYELYDLCTSGDLGGGEGLLSAKSTVTIQIAKLRKNIAATELEMRNCGMSTSV